MYLKSQLLEKLDERAFKTVELHKLFLAYERNEVYLPYFSYKYLLKSLFVVGFYHLFLFKVHIPKLNQSPMPMPSSSIAVINFNHDILAINLETNSNFVHAL